MQEKLQISLIIYIYIYIYINLFFFFSYWHFFASDQVGRYGNPDQHAFFPNQLPESMLPPLHYPQVVIILFYM